MRIAISNIAWDPPEDREIAALLHRHGLDAIDVAPPKYFPDPGNAADSEIERVRGWWADRGIEITGMQSLLFGAAGLNLFGSKESRAAMLARLESVCRIGGGLGATRLVFGSPKNRDRDGLSDSEALDIAVPFFRDLGERGARHGVTICLEPNPVRYGCNFMTTTQEAADVVRAVHHPAIRLHLDSGTIAINGEDPAVAIESAADIIGHVHASEPDLVPLGDGGAPHAAIAAMLRRKLPHHVVSIEMVATKNEPHAESIERALNVAIGAYAQ